jgi:hypothetical protein
MLGLNPAHNLDPLRAVRASSMLGRAIHFSLIFGDIPQFRRSRHIPRHHLVKF